MSMLSAPRLHKLIEEGVITCWDTHTLHENVNSGSLDIRIGNKILVEKQRLNGYVWNHPVDIDAKESPQFTEVEIPEEGYILEPGQAILACSMETFNLPNTVSAMFKLRSSMGRCFLNHMMAGWADAGWHGAQLTMEFVNQTQYHRLLIKPGMRVGQMVFFEHEDAGKDSYSVKGNYNNQQGPTVAFAGQVVEIK